MAEGQHLQLKFTAVVPNLQMVADPDLTGRLRFLAVAFDSAQFTSTGGECARFEEPGCPEPFVYPHLGLTSGMIHSPVMEQGL